MNIWKEIAALLAPRKRSRVVAKNGYAVNRKRRNRIRNKIAARSRAANR